MYELIIMPQAKKVYDKANLETQKRIDSTIESIGENPFSLGTKKIVTQKGCYSRRVGDFRILFRLERKEKRCTILAIKKRDKAYR